MRCPMNPEQMTDPPQSRTDMWREVLEDDAKLRKCADEYRRKVLLVTHFFDKHLGKNWRSMGNLEDGVEFEIALLELEKLLAKCPKKKPRGGSYLA